MAEEKILATPDAKRLASEKAIDLSLVRGTGELGSILARDVNSFKQIQQATPVAKKMAAYYQINLEKVQQDGKIRKQDIEKIVAFTKSAEESANKAKTTQSAENETKMSGMRKVIAERMVGSLQIAPQYTLFNELDTTDLLALLKESKSIFTKLSGSKLTFTDILVKIIALALSKHPAINASIQGDKIVIHSEINVGVAVAMDEGLIVPVIKNADKLSLSEINKISQDLFSRARAGKLSPDEYQGGTFTISNLGMYPVDFSTPIINQPESAILGVGRTVQKPVVVDNNIVIRSMSGFSLTLDHRNIDGAVGAAFLATLEELISNPLCVLA